MRQLGRWVVQRSAQVGQQPQSGRGHGEPAPSGRGAIDRFHGAVVGLRFGLQVGFTSLLADLATLCANHIQPADQMPAFTKLTTPTPLHRRAYELLDVSHRFGYM